MDRALRAASEPANNAFWFCRVSLRLEFDAYRNDYEALQNVPRDSATMAKMDEAQRKFHNHKEKFDKLRADVGIKLKFLDENKVGLYNVSE